MFRTRAAADGCTGIQSDDATGSRTCVRYILLRAFLGSQTADCLSASVQYAYTSARSGSQYGQSSGALSRERRSRYHVPLGSYVHRRITSPVVQHRDSVEHRSQLSAKHGRGSTHETFTTYLSLNSYIASETTSKNTYLPHLIIIIKLSI